MSVLVLEQILTRLCLATDNRKMYWYSFRCGICSEVSWPVPCVWLPSLVPVCQNEVYRWYGEMCCVLGVCTVYIVGIFTVVTIIKECVPSLFRGVELRHYPDNNMTQTLLYIMSLGFWFDINFCHWFCAGKSARIWWAWTWWWQTTGNHLSLCQEIGKLHEGQ